MTILLHRSMTFLAGLALALALFGAAAPSVFAQNQAVVTPDIFSEKPLKVEKPKKVKKPSTKERLAQLESQIAEYQATQEFILDRLTHIHDEDISSLYSRTNDLRDWLERGAKPSQTPSIPLGTQIIRNESSH